MSALKHLKILDMTRVLAGPWCTQTLADLGADVIKIERPGAGDDTRQWAPPYFKAAQGQNTSEAAYYASVNRNKRSVTLDIASPEGQEIVRKMAQQCDVLVENYKVGQLARYGLDYESLKKLNPGLVYCSITGFGQTGPYAPRAGYDFIVQGMGGFMSITGERDDLPGGGPQKAGVAIADLFTGAHATIAILAALAHKDRTGEGQHLDICLLDVQVAMLANMASNFMATGKAPGRWGNAHPNIAPYQTFAVADGWIIIACGNDGQFRKLVHAGGEDALASDPRFTSNAQRLAHRADLIAALESMMRRKTKAQWIELLEREGVPCGPINDIAEVFQDPQVQARGMRVELPHPSAGQMSLTGSALKLSQTPVQYRRHPPTLGEHTEEVLSEFAGLSAQDVAGLRERGLV